MSTPIVTLDLQDRFDKATSDLSDAISAARAMCLVEGMREMERNSALSVVVRALDAAWSDIIEIWPRIPYEGKAKDEARRRAERLGPEDLPSQGPGTQAQP